LGSESWHEPYAKLSEATRDLHRAYISVCEELEALDWYQQRIDACADPDLRAILAHNRAEEKEHATMVLEWIRRHDPQFAAAFDTYLYTAGDVTKIEEEAEGKKPAGEGPSGGAGTPSTPGFTVGSLKGSGP